MFTGSSSSELNSDSEDRQQFPQSVVNIYQTLRHIPEGSNYCYRYVCSESRVNIWIFCLLFVPLSSIILSLQQFRWYWVHPLHASSRYSVCPFSRKLSEGRTLHINDAGTCAFLLGVVNALECLH
jgi:hypothetical protein